METANWPHILLINHQILQGRRIVPFIMALRDQDSQYELVKILDG